MFFMGPAELLVVTLMGFGIGGAGLPMGLPPGEEDPLLAKVAPDECTLYVRWAGMAAPDASSGNKTEQLLAEAEIRRFFEHLDGAITAGLLSEARNDETARKLASEAPKIVRAMLTRPTAIMLGKVGFGLKGFEVDGGIIVNTGEQTGELMQVVENLEALLGDQVKEVEVGDVKFKEFPMPEGMPRMMWGFRGRYMVGGVGEGSVENIFNRARTGPPAWLTEVEETLKVDRRASVMYVDVKKLTALATGMPGGLGPGGPGPNEINSLLRAMGLDNLKYFAGVTGLDETGVVTRQLLALDGEPRGVFSLAGGEALTAQDLTVIPRDATFALAARFDAKKAYDQLVETIASIDPRAREEFEREVKQAEDELGLSVVDDIISPLGDTWRMYNSPSEGGLIITGLTAVVSLRDRDRAVKTMERLAEIANADAKRRVEAADDPFGRQPRHVRIDDFEFHDEKIYFMNFIGEQSPFAFAWCATRDELILSFFPSQIKAYLSRGEDFQSIADVPQVAGVLSGSDGPIMLGYQETRELFRLSYPIVQIVAQFMCSQAQRSGVNIDMSMFPSARVIERHLLPSVTTVLRTEQGIEMINRQTAPVGAGVMPLLLPAMMFMARTAPRPIEEFDLPAAEPAAEAPAIEPDVRIQRAKEIERPRRVEPKRRPRPQPKEAPEKEDVRPRDERPAPAKKR